MREVKLNRQPLDQTLQGIHQAAQSLQMKAADDIGGQNNLEIVKQLNRLRQSLVEITETYQLVMKQHVDSTSRALDSLEETEGMTAQSIQHLTS